MRLARNTFLVTALMSLTGCTKVHLANSPVDPPPPGAAGAPSVSPPAVPTIVPIDPGPPGVGADCTPPASASVMLPADHISQQSDLLCWAASGQAVARAFKVPYSQCAQLQDYPGYSCPMCLTCDASKDLPPSGCNHPGLPNFDKLGLTHKKTTNEALSLAQIQFEIGCRKQPVVFIWQMGPGASHMMVVYGYSADKLDIMQPLQACVGDTFTTDYATYQETDTDGGQHLDDFYDFSVK